MTPKISQEEKAARLATLQTLLDERLAASLAAQVGARALVLVEGQSRRSTGPAWTGRDPGGRIVNVRLPDRKDDYTGRIVPARIVQAKRHSLIGEAEADHEGTGRSNAAVSTK